jgi:hypothetical protein
LSVIFKVYIHYKQSVAGYVAQFINCAEYSTVPVPVGCMRVLAILEDSVDEDTFRNTSQKKFD